MNFDNGLRAHNNFLLLILQFKKIVYFFVLPIDMLDHSRHAWKERHRFEKKDKKINYNSVRLRFSVEMTKKELNIGFFFYSSSLFWHTKFKVTDAINHLRKRFKNEFFLFPFVLFLWKRSIFRRNHLIISTYITIRNLFDFDENWQSKLFKRLYIYSICHRWFEHNWCTKLWSYIKTYSSTFSQNVDITDIPTKNNIETHTYCVHFKMHSRFTYWSLNRAS